MVVNENHEAVTLYHDYAYYHLGRVKEKRSFGFTCCPMCSLELSVSHTGGTAQGREYYATTMIPRVDYSLLYRCASCGWWSIREQVVELEANPLAGNDTLIVAVGQHFDIRSKDAPISVLCDYMAHHPQHSFKILDPFAFEKLIAECLRYEFAPCEVHHIGARGGRGDKGIDIYMIKDGEPWFVQVKRRLSDKPESLEVVRLLNGVLFRERANNGIVVTTAERFANGARQEVEMARAVPRPYTFRLYDRGDVYRMIQRVPATGAKRWDHALSEKKFRREASKIPVEILAALSAPIPDDYWGFRFRDAKAEP